MSEDLGKLRDAIDLIDREVLAALARRMQLSDKVIAAKGGVAAFRPGREAQLVRQLVATCDASGLDLAPAVVLGIWRQIMAASLGRQNGGLTCAVHPDALAAAVWHMGAMVEIDHAADLTTLLGRLAGGSCRYALVPATGDLAALAAVLAAHEGLFIMARTPLFDMPAIPPAFIIATYLPDPSGDDISLFLSETATATLDIVAVDGYHDAAPDNLAGARLVGIYAR